MCNYWWSEPGRFLVNMFKDHNCFDETEYREIVKQVETTTDNEQRFQLVEQAQKYLMEEMVVIPLYTTSYVKIYDQSLSNIHFIVDGMFQNRYTAEGGPGMIAFASSLPGDIRAFEIGPGRELVVQKRGFLASETGVVLSVFFQKKLGAGLFGGEGFVLQKLSGSGVAFCEFDGHVRAYDLAAGEALLADTGCLAAMDATCTLEIEAVKGAKNVLFGGEGLFNTRVTGPGRVWLQTMRRSPFQRLLSIRTGRPWRTR